MSEQNLTSWFPNDVAPAYVGVYETNSETMSGPCFQKWNGEFWQYCSSNVDSAFDNDALGASNYQSPKWRGLTEPADAAQ